MIIINNERKAHLLGRVKRKPQRVEADGKGEISVRGLGKIEKEVDLVSYIIDCNSFSS